MKEIWKFTILIIDRVQVQMPVGAEVLSVCEQYQKIVLYALVSPSQPMSTRDFTVVGTGHTVHDSHRMKFIGTVSLSHGFSMFHVFEEVVGAQSVKMNLSADDLAIELP